MGDEMMLSILVVLYPDLFPKDDLSEVIKEKVETLESEVLQLTGKMAKVEAENVERKDCVESEMSELRDTNERSESELTELRETNKRLGSEMSELREHFQCKLSELC